MFQAPFVVVRDATQAILRRLDHLPPSERREELYACVEERVRESEQWQVHPPARRDVDSLMTRLLAVHVEVTKLERHAFLAEPRAMPEVVPHARLCK